MIEHNLFVGVDDDGNVISHPILQDNLRLFYPDISANNIPKGFALFVRREEPETDLGEKYVSSSYGIDESLSTPDKKVYTDIHEIKKLENEDRERIINEFRANNPNFKDWVYDENINSLVPPIPKPEDGKEYVWIVGGGWIEKPNDTDDVEQYKFSLMIDDQTYNLNKGQSQTVYEDGNIYYIRLEKGSITIDNSGPNPLSLGDIYFNDGSNPSIVTSLEDDTVIVTGLHNYQIDQFLTSLTEEERVAFIRNLNFKG